MANITGLDYSNIENNYNDLLERENDLSEDDSTVGVSDIGTRIVTASESSIYQNNKIETEQSSIDGASLNNIWIDTYIKSRNYQPKIQGFHLDGKTGYIECMKLYVGNGGIIGGSLDIPNITTTNSFHVESDGDTFWGCTSANFTADNDNANAYILKTGVAKFQNVILENSVTLRDIQSGSEIAIQGWQQNMTFSATVDDSLTHTAGTITLLDGTTYSIDTQTWINISSLFYVYLDINVSTTSLQATYASANAVGSGKILIAVASNSSDITSTLTYQVFGGKGGINLSVDNISANSASTNEFISNTAQIKDLIVTNAKIGNLNAGKITTGELVVARTQAKCTDANADQTSANNQGVSWLDEASGSVLPVANTAAKCTDADADETQAALTAGANIDNAKADGTTLISGGYINTGIITATNINTGTLTGRTVQTSSSSTSGCKLTAASGLKIYGQYATWYSGSTAVGQIYATSTTNLQMYTYSNITLELGGSEGASLNAGDNNCELRTGDSAHIRCSDSNYSGFVGTSSKVFSSMYATTYYFARSGETTKYLQMGTSGSIETNGNFYVGGTLSKSAGTFKIDHPLKPKTHWLQHSFVESPDMLNIYTGNAKIVDGECIIKMPNWFIPLNGDNKKDFTYQLTSIGKINNLFIKKEMNKKGIVTFAGKDGRFSYIITAIRHDRYAIKNRVQVESKKII